MHLCIDKPRWPPSAGKAFRGNLFLKDPYGCEITYLHEITLCDLCVFVCLHGHTGDLFPSQEQGEWKNFLTKTSSQASIQSCVRHDRWRERFIRLNLSHSRN